MRVRACVVSLWVLAGSVGPAAQSRPNILWITSEDNAPNLGVYGDRDANVALLAQNGLAHVPDLPADFRAAVGALPKGPARSDQRGNGIQRVIDRIAQGVH